MSVYRGRIPAGFGREAKHVIPYEPSELDPYSRATFALTHAGETVLILTTVTSTGDECVTAEVVEAGRPRVFFQSRP